MVHLPVVFSRSALQRSFSVGQCPIAFMYSKRFDLFWQWFFNGPFALSLFYIGTKRTGQHYNKPCPRPSFAGLSNDSLGSRPHITIYNNYWNIRLVHPIILIIVALLINTVLYCLVVTSFSRHADCGVDRNPCAPTNLLHLSCVDLPTVDDHSPWAIWNTQKWNQNFWRWRRFGSWACATISDTSSCWAARTTYWNPKHPTRTQTK